MWNTVVDAKNIQQLKSFARENRKEQTEAEGVLWKYLRRKNLGVHFKRQFVISDFIVDFVCVNKKVVIEIDGEYHRENCQKEYDEGRSQILNRLGYTVIRFTNEDIISNLTNVLNIIKENI